MTPRLISRRKFVSLSSLAAITVFSAPSLSLAESILNCNNEPTKSLDLLIDEYLESQLSIEGIAIDESIACSVYDLVQKKYFVNLLEDIPLQCASMVKPLVALAFFHKAKYEDMTYGYASQEMMQRMIIQSDNEATNWLLSRIGGPQETDQLLRTYYGDILKNFSIVEYIPTSAKKSGRTYKNKASAADYRRILTALWEDHLPYSRELLELMALPGAADRIDFGIPEATVYNKTGSTGHLCGDMGIVTGQNEQGVNYAYSFVMIIESPQLHKKDYGAWITRRAEVIRDVSRLVHGEVIKMRLDS
ncbi:serine hydrolase [Candidatus Woesearchaeota archaeon]|nr:serine hydrolase [Candidatus Woesearchaeota archaeon]